MSTIVAFKPELPIEEAAEIAIQTMLALIRKGHSMVLTLSSGKDSTTTTLLGLEAVRRATAEGFDQATHYISSSTTSVESPEIENALLEMHTAIERWAAEMKLKIDVRMVEPALASKFVVSTIGRGTLPRFIENGSANRTCSTDWKVKPQQRLAKQIIEECRQAGRPETITVLGSRFEESTVRGSSMRRRGDQAQAPSRNPDGFLTLSVIAEWTESMVWEFLVQFLTPDLAPFPAYTGSTMIRSMLDVYRDGNEGTCGMFLGDGKRAPCGSRFGCSTCCLTGEKDKSMESLLNSDSRYEYMRGLNNFRNFLVATQWDMSRRELVGRTISDAGFIPVRPDVYSLQQRMALLRYMLTIDVVEQERAEEMDGLVASGQVPATPENQRMRNAQFEHISYKEIAMIDFYWSMHHYTAHAFPALAIWYEIKVLGRRYPVPKLPTSENTGIPSKRWYHVGNWDAEAPVDGLRDYIGEMWNPYIHPEREMTHRMIGRERGPWFVDGEDGLEVDAMEACLHVETYCEGDMYTRTQHHDAIESARFWLNEEIVKLPPGMAMRYHHMAKRAQYFAHLATKLNVTPAELDLHLQANSISDAEHNKLLPQRVDTPAHEQVELFAA